MHYSVYRVVQKAVIIMDAFWTTR